MLRFNNPEFADLEQGSALRQTPTPTSLGNLQYSTISPSIPGFPTPGLAEDAHHICEDTTAGRNFTYGARTTPRLY